MTVKRVISKKDLKICKFFTGFYKFYITLTNFVKDLNNCFLEYISANCANILLENAFWSELNPKGILTQHYNIENNNYEPSSNDCIWICEESYVVKNGECVKELIPIFNNILPQFVMELYPSGEKSRNVIQGFEVDYKNKTIYKLSSDGSELTSTLSKTFTDKFDSIAVIK